MAAAKTRERIYFQTDTHWNDRGAFVAYRELIEAVRAQVPAVAVKGEGQLPRPRSQLPRVW